jgi:peptide/nickel transport system permease protein
MRRAGIAVLGVLLLLAVLAPWLSPNAPNERFGDLLYAPPTPVHLFDDGLRAPFVRPWQLVDRRAREFRASPGRVPLRWLADGHLVTAAPRDGAPLLLLGADAYGRDIFSRLLFGARATLALAVAATLGASLLGMALGALAGSSRGWLDQVVSRGSEFLLVLPAVYVALAVRAVLPLTLAPSDVFLSLAAIFALLGSPIVGRGVRAILVTERERDYAMAARAAGTTPLRLLVRHLLPAAWSYVAVQATLLFPAFILAESTLSYVGFGFPPSVPTWGTMLQDAANVSLLADTPWVLAPAAAIFLAALGANLAVQGSGRAPVQLEP